MVRVNWLILSRIWVGWSLGIGGLSLVRLFRDWLISVRTQGCWSETVADWLIFTCANLSLTGFHKHV